MMHFIYYINRLSYYINRLIATKVDSTYGGRWAQTGDCLSLSRLRTLHTYMVGHWCHKCLLTPCFTRKVKCLTRRANRFTICFPLKPKIYYILMYCFTCKKPSVLRVTFISVICSLWLKGSFI